MSTPYGEGTAITPDPPGDIPAPPTAPGWAVGGQVMLPSPDRWPSRCARAASLYDAIVPELRLGNGHAVFALREAVEYAALFRDEGWVTTAVQHLVRPQFRDGTATRLRHIVRSAIVTEET